MTVRTPAILLIALAACKAPPPAPEGLDESARYMVRNFYADDLTFQAGIQGFVDWYENGGGKELVGAVPSEETPTDAFQVQTLEAEDVQFLPLDEEIILEPNDPGDPADDEVGPRDLSLAVGVVSISNMACSWKEAERLLALPNQDGVFADDWEDYQRTYVTSREPFEAARESLEFAPLPTPIDPYGSDIALDEYDSTLLFTDNIADPAPAPLVGNLPPFPLKLEFRHGMFEIPDVEEPVGVVAVLTYAPSAFWGDEGKNGMRQSYSVELNVEQADGTTTRMLAIWNEPDILGIDPSSDIAKAVAVNKSASSSDRMKAVCEGTEPIEE